MPRSDIARDEMGPSVKGTRAAEFGGIGYDEVSLQKLWPEAHRG